MRVATVFRSLIINRRRSEGPKTITPLRIRSRISLSPASSGLVRRCWCSCRIHLLRQYGFKCNMDENQFSVVRVFYKQQGWQQTCQNRELLCMNGPRKMSQCI